MRVGEPSPRMLLARLTCLPDTSALAAAVQSAPRGWGGDRHSLVTLIDALQQNTYATVAVATKRRPSKPKPMPRPKGPRKKVTVAELAAAQAAKERGVRTHGGTGR